MAWCLDEANNIKLLRELSINVSQSANTNNSEMVRFQVTRATREKLMKLKIETMNYSDLILSAISGENKDVKKIDAIKA